MHLIERRGEQQIQYDALVLAMSMQAQLRGVHGEMAIDAVCVNPLHTPAKGDSPEEHLIYFTDVVHVSHRDWIERRTHIGYEEAKPSYFFNNFAMNHTNVSGKGAKTS